MRKLPIFTKKEIDFIENAVCESQKELIQEKGLPCLSFTPFKNDLLNKVVKYKHVIDEIEYVEKRRTEKK